MKYTLISWDGEDLVPEGAFDTVENACVYIKRKWPTPESRRGLDIELNENGKHIATVSSYDETCSNCGNEAVTFYDITKHNKVNTVCWNCHGKNRKGAGFFRRMLRHPKTGGVMPDVFWRSVFIVTPEDLWGGPAFDDAGLVEVEPDGSGGWREVKN